MLLRELILLATLLSSAEAFLSTQFFRKSESLFRQTVNVCPTASKSPSTRLQMANAEGMYPIIGDEDIMKPKAHGTSAIPVQTNLRWNCDRETADRICNYNRHWAEYSGYWLTTTFLKEADRTKPITFYDSNTGKALFIAPKGRTFEAFVEESASHGWPSFRDEEVVWENVRCLRNGEAVSIDGTHLGHNIPDRKGNRYCINLIIFQNFSCIVSFTRRNLIEGRKQDPPAGTTKASSES